MQQPHYRRPAGTLRLDIGRADHLIPRLGFVGDEFAKFGVTRELAPIGKFNGEFASCSQTYPAQGS
jgi:hypothetical protein